MRVEPFFLIFCLFTQSQTPGALSRLRLKLINNFVEKEGPDSALDMHRLKSAINLGHLGYNPKNMRV